MRSNFSFSAQQRSDARSALKILEGSDLSLTEAARRAVAGVKAVKKITVYEAFDAFLAFKLRDGVREKTYSWYEDRLRVVIEKFGDKKMDEVSRADFRAWVAESGGRSKSTREATTRAARTLWKWAAAQEPPLAGDNPTHGLQTNSSKGNAGEAEFLTVGEVEKIINGAERFKSAAALMLFAGIRPDEIAGRKKPRLLWRHVDVSGKLIRIPSEVAKTGKPRIIEELPFDFWDLLDPKNPDEPISRAMSQQVRRHIRSLIKRDWPHDATRHTFATYALAITGDAGKVATWLGHEGKPAMLHNHYRGMATKTEAEKFAGLCMIKKL